MEHSERFPLKDGLDPNPSPSSDEGSASTPDTPFTPLEIPFPKIPTTQDPRLSARSKLAQLSLEEKAIPDKGIPAIKTSDGPNGARGGIFVGGTKAALFPCGISLAATWNQKLLYQIGEHLADEVKARSANVLLAPTVCMHRHPLGGRNFESFSEDPLLTGKLAARYIQGVQSRGVAATIKHFVANEQETNRLTIDSVVMERPLREIYLKPFEIAIREANPWAVMSSYNLVNGVHADMNHHTLKDILRGEWGYDGTVVSDWGGVNSTAESIKAGCDIEFPYSDKWRLDKVLAALEDGSLTQEHVNSAAENVLTLVERTKGGDMTPEAAEREDDRAATRALIREAGVQGLTLLKNEGAVLPIDPATPRVAVIGPNANRAIAGGGGSASLNPYYNTLPLDSIRAAAHGEVTYAQGCHIFKWLPVASPFCTDAEGRPGVTLEWYRGDGFAGEVAVRQRRPNTDLFLWDSAPLAEVGPAWSAVATTALTPTATGTHTLSFMSVGPGRLFVDGALALDLWDWTEEGEAMFDGSVDHTVDVAMRAGRPVALRVEMTNELRPAAKQAREGRTHKYGGCRLGFQQADAVDYLAEAAAAARAADVAVVVVGLDAEWESEGYDRQTLALPRDGSQDRLVAAVAAANPRTVVVNQSGSPVAMPWAARVPAILQAWYQGQEAGRALADVLFGARSPAGKLPTTFPRRLEDAPAFHSWPGENGRVLYGEGLFVGYRHYDRCALEPLFPFGHGLSYTTFAYGPATLRGGRVLGGGGGGPQDNADADEDTAAPAAASPRPSSRLLHLVLPVTNTGPVAGAETVQVYVRPEFRPALPRPAKELVAFDKVGPLAPGATAHVVLPLDRHAVGYYDDARAAWVAEAGVYTALVGSSSVDIRQSVSFEVQETFTWVF